MASLTIFVVAYLGLAGWLLWTSYRLFSAGGENVIVGASTAFLKVDPLVKTIVGPQ